MSSLQSAIYIAQTYTVQTDGLNTASEAKKPSKRQSFNLCSCNTTSTNCTNTFACLRVMNNTFGACFNLPDYTLLELDAVKANVCT